MTTPDRRRQCAEHTPTDSKRARKAPHQFTVCTTANLSIKPEAREFEYTGPAALAVVKETRWTRKPQLTVGFIDRPAPSAALQRKIVQYMNEWSKYTSAKFMLMKIRPMSAQVRITLSPEQWGVEGGYWSYVGTTILSRQLAGEPTMCLEGFSLATPDSEYMRVVCHETGHTLGFPHEHMRQEIVSLLDPAKTIKYMQDEYGWSPQDTTEQVLTPLDPSTLEATREADEQSIMCYQLPGECTKSGDPIVGGDKIDLIDQHFAASIYPKSK